MTVHSRGTLNSDHRRHDRLLVTRFAAGDPYPADEAEAEGLIANCPDCAELAADVRLLATRTRDLPAPRRTRDFRISPEQAQNLRGSWLERLMRGIAAPGWGTALRPVAGAAFAIGMTLMVVGGLPLGTAQPASAPAADRGSVVTTDNAILDAPTIESVGAPEPAAPGDAPAARGGEDGDATADPDELSQAYLTAETPGAFDQGGGREAARSSTADNGRPFVLTGALAAALGIALFGLAWLARRRFGDALLR